MKNSRFAKVQNEIEQTAMKIAKVDEKLELIDLFKMLGDSAKSHKHLKKLHKERDALEQYTAEGERNLWAAVIAQAVRDLFNRPVVRLDNKIDSIYRTIVETWDQLQATDLAKYRRAQIRKRRKDAIKQFHALLDHDYVTAYQFLFNPNNNSLFHSLDQDPEAMREQMLNRMIAGETPEWRNARINLINYKKMKTAKKKIDAEISFQDSTTKKLNSNDIPLIRGLFQQGVTQKVIAEKFDVNPSVISRICSGVSWAHIEGVAT